MSFKKGDSVRIININNMFYQNSDNELIVKAKKSIGKIKIIKYVESPIKDHLPYKLRGLNFLFWGDENLKKVKSKTKRK